MVVLMNDVENHAKKCLYRFIVVIVCYQISTVYALFWWVFQCVSLYKNVLVQRQYFQAMCSMGITVVGRDLSAR